MTIVKNHDNMDHIASRGLSLTSCQSCFYKYDLVIPKMAPLPGVCWENAISEIQNAWKKLAKSLEAKYPHQ